MHFIETIFQNIIYFTIIKNIIIITKLLYYYYLYFVFVKFISVSIRKRHLTVFLKTRYSTGIQDKTVG